MSQKKAFYVIFNKIIGVKFLKTQKTLLKYQNLYPDKLYIEKFDLEQEALKRFEKLQDEFIFYKDFGTFSILSLYDDKKSFSLKSSYISTSSVKDFTKIKN